MKINIYNLYFRYLFNKIIIASIFISFMILNIILIFTIRNSKQYPDYLYNSLIIHQNYINISYLIINIFNIIIITLISIIYNIKANNFDILFISRLKKTKIYITKLINTIFIILIISLIEFLNINLIGLLFYKEFVIELIDIMNLFQIFMSMLLFYLISMLFTLLINNIIIPLLFMFILISFRILINNIEKIQKISIKILPIINYKGNIYDQTGTFLSLIWIFLLIILTFLVYNIKDLKYFY